MFGTTRFHFFYYFQFFAHFPLFLVLSHYHDIDCSYFTLLAFKKGALDIKILKDIDSGFNGFEKTFSKKLIDISNFVF